MKNRQRSREETEQLHRLRLFSGAVRCIAEAALQEEFPKAVTMVAYVEALSEFVERELTTLLSDV